MIHSRVTDERRMRETREVVINRWCRQEGERDSFASIGPFVFAQVKHGVGVEAVVANLLHAWQHARGVAHVHP